MFNFYFSLAFSRKVSNFLILLGRFSILAILFVCFFSVKIFTQENSINLIVGVGVEKDLAENESQTFHLKAQINDFVRVSVVQQNADVNLKVFTPDGQKLYEADNFNERSDSERCSFIAATGGEYRVEIGFVAKLRGQSSGKSYNIRIEALRPPTEKDREQISAETFYDRAALLINENKAESRRAALPLFQTSLSHFQAAGNRVGEAQTFYALGITHSLLSEVPPAQENFAQAAQIFRSLNMKSQLVSVIVQDAQMYLFVNDNAKAEELSLAALDIYRELGDRRGEAEIIGNLGVLANRKNEPRRALEYFEQALPILRAEKDHDHEARILRSIGLTYSNLGEPFKAIESLEKALAINRADNELLGVSTALIGLGVLSRTVGEAQRATDQLNEALAIVRQIGNRRNETVCLNNLGSNYDYLGETQKARENYEKSLVLARELKMRDFEVNSLNGISNIELKEGNTSKALEMFTQAWQIAREIGNKRIASKLLARIGETRLKLGEKEKAIESLNQALAVQRELEDREGEAVTLFLIGKTHRQSGDLTTALETDVRALKLAQEMKNPSLQSEIYWEMANIEKDSKNLPAAQTNIEKAIEIAESTRSKLIRQDFRLSYFSAQQSFYEFYVNVLAAQGKNAEALQASEQARARSLIESIGESRSNIRAGITPELLKEENFLRGTINAKETQRLNAVGQKNLSKASAFEKEIGEAIEKYRDLQTKIQKQSPQFTALTDPKPLNLLEMQATLLDENTVLLEYTLGAERSYLFAVSKKDFKVFVLPGQAEIEKSARKFYEGLRGRGLNPTGETLVKRRERLEQSDNFLENSSIELSKTLLEPVAQTIKNKRLLIVTSGILQYIPFAALPSPITFDSKIKVQNTKIENHFLIQTNEVVYLPSASALATLRKPFTKTSLNSISVLADPVFSSDDIRIKTNARQNQTKKPIDDVAALRGDLGRLRFSRQEAEIIMEFVPENKRTVALDFNANLTTAKSANFNQSKILHFATHGYVRSDFPDLSGLVLSLFNENGEPQDGFLHLYEIYNLNLNAELIVLSACETALGKDIRGEGLVGLTHGFLIAGSKRVVASLWRVDDKATAELMRRFYGGMIKENLRTAEALRKAQISLIQDKNFNHPFYWAAFTLQGEPK